LEEKGLFSENVYDSKKNKIIFFNKGPSNDWRKVLDKKIQDDIEKIFNKEMKELGYI
jgi:isocitrate lyase